MVSDDMVSRQQCDKPMSERPTCKAVSSVRQERTSGSDRLLLHLVRHGQTDWNATRRIQGHRDVPLNDAGREQARALGADLAGMRFDRVYCSTSCRARETADLVLQQSGQHVEYRDELREICLGEWEGWYWADLEQLYPDMCRQFFRSVPGFRAPGAETHAEVQARGVKAIERIVDDVGRGDVLVVSHGALLKRLFAAYTGTDLANRTNLPVLANCAHSIIEATGNQRRLLTVGGTPVHETPWSSPEPVHREQVEHKPAMP